MTSFKPRYSRLDSSDGRTKVWRARLQRSVGLSDTTHESRGEWTQLFDTDSGLPYYYRSGDGVARPPRVQWEEPTEWASGGAAADNLHDDSLSGGDDTDSSDDLDTSSGGGGGGGGSGGGHAAWAKLRSVVNVAGRAIRDARHAAHDRRVNEGPPERDVQEGVIRRILSTSSDQQQQKLQNHDEKLASPSSSSSSSSSPSSSRVELPSLAVAEEFARSKELHGEGYSMCTLGPAKFAAHGIGLSLYFRFVKGMALLMLGMTLLHVPHFAMHLLVGLANPKGSASTFLSMTIGGWWPDLGFNNSLANPTECAAVNISGELAFPERTNLNITLGGNKTREFIARGDAAFILAMLDVFAQVIFLGVVGIFALQFASLARKRRVEKPFPSYYAVEVMGLPSSLPWRKQAGDDEGATLTADAAAFNAQLPESQLKSHLVQALGLSSTDDIAEVEVGVAWHGLLSLHKRRFKYIRQLEEIRGRIEFLRRQARALRRETQRQQPTGTTTTGSSGGSQVTPQPPAAVDEQLQPASSDNTSKTTTTPSTTPIRKTNTFARRQLQFLGKAEKKLFKEKEAKLTKKIQKLSDTIDETRQQPRQKDQAVCAFVVFSNERAAVHCQNAFGKPCPCACGCMQPKRLRFLEHHALQMVAAPEPNDIVWEALEYGRCSRAARWAGIIFVCVLLLVAAVVVFTSFTLIGERILLSQENLGKFCFDDIRAKATTTTLPESRLAFFSNPDLFDVCVPRMVDILAADGGYYAVALFIVLFNVGIKEAMNFLIPLTRSRTQSGQMLSLTKLVFVMTFLNTALIFLAVNGNLEHVQLAKWVFLISSLGSLNLREALGLPESPHCEMSSDWFATVGFSLTFTLFINVLVALKDVAFWMPVEALQRECVRCRVRRGSFVRGTQRELNRLMMKSEWEIWDRFPLAMNTVFVALCYGSGLPILYLIAFVALLAQYCADKYAMLHHFRAPPQFDKHIAMWCIEVMPISLLFHGIIGIWVYGNVHLTDSCLLGTEDKDGLAGSGSAFAAVGNAADTVFQGTRSGTGSGGGSPQHVGASLSLTVTMWDLIRAHVLRTAALPVVLFLVVLAAWLILRWTFGTLLCRPLARLLTCRCCVCCRNAMSIREIGLRPFDEEKAGFEERSIQFEYDIEKHPHYRDALHGADSLGILSAKAARNKRLNQTFHKKVKTAGLLSHLVGPPSRSASKYGGVGEEEGGAGGGGGGDDFGPGESKGEAVPAAKEGEGSDKQRRSLVLTQATAGGSLKLPPLARPAPPDGTRRRSGTV
eukprot:g4559.t1